MMEAPDPAAPDGPLAFADAVRRRLDAVGEAGGRIAFWWRDDDAVAATPALDRLLAVAGDAGVPIGLAVIPAGAETSLADRLSDAPGAAILQHGWAHANHEPAGGRAAELGAARPAEVVLEELGRGRARLAEVFGDRPLPILVPPWNRIAAEIAGRRREVGLDGLSTFTARTVEDRRVDCHLDPIAWKTTRGFVGWAKMLRILDEEIEGRAGRASPAPIGLLTHHLVHDEAVWAFTEAFVSVAARHPAALWPPIGEAFGLG